MSALAAVETIGANANDAIKNGISSGLDELLARITQNPDKSVQILEEHFTEDMLGVFNIDLMKNYIRKRGTTIEVNGVSLYYETVGNGPHAVLLCPGTPGTIAADFMPQMMPGGFDREKYTVVSFEPRGYGGSYPPKRTGFKHGYQVQDAQDAVTLMEKLGHRRFSWVGWCAGGNIGIVAAALYPHRIRALVCWGSYPIVTEKAYEHAKQFEDTSKWSEQMVKPKLLEYDREYLQFLFSNLFKYKQWVYENNQGDCVKSYLPKVECPTLVMWLKADLMTEKEQADVIIRNVPKAKLHVVEDGKHAFHLRYPVRFRAIVEEFLATVP